MAKSPPHSIIPRPYTLTEQWYPIFFWNGRNLPLFHGTTPIKDSIYFFVHKILCAILVKLWLNSTTFKITFTWCFLVQMGVFAIVNCCPPVAVMVAAEWYLVGSSSHLHDNQWSAIQPNPVLHGIKTAPPPFHSQYQTLWWRVWNEEEGTKTPSKISKFTSTSKSKSWT